MEAAFDVSELVNLDHARSLYKEAVGVYLSEFSAGTETYFPNPYRYTAKLSKGAAKDYFRWAHAYITAIVVRVPGTRASADVFLLALTKPMRTAAARAAGKSCKASNAGDVGKPEDLVEQTHTKSPALGGI